MGDQTFLAAQMLPRYTIFTNLQWLFTGVKRPNLLLIIAWFAGNWTSLLLQKKTCLVQQITSFFHP